MKKIILIFCVLNFSFENKAICQTSQCELLKSIVQLFKNWQYTDTLPKPPLIKQQEKALLGNNQIDGRSAKVYSIKGKFSNEFKSEAKIDILNKCSYTALLGPFVADNVDSAGIAFKDILTSCDPIKNWKTSTIKNIYFYTSSRIRIDKVDMYITISKVQSKQKGKYWIKVFMFRF